MYEQLQSELSECQHEDNYFRQIEKTGIGFKQYLKEYKRIPLYLQKVFLFLVVHGTSQLPNPSFTMLSFRHMILIVQNHAKGTSYQ